jgi:predicted nucleic acid-binding protein
MVVWAAQKAGNLDVARLDALFIDIAKARGRLVLPTPALAELFVRSSGAATSAWLAALQKKQAIKVADFDVRAAAECGAIHRRAEVAGGKRQHVKAGEAYQKIKVDRQIAAIALVERSNIIVTDDGNLRAICEANGLRVLSISDLPVPDTARQVRIDEVPDEPDGAGYVTDPAAPWS